MATFGNMYLDNNEKAGVEFILGSGHFIDRKALEVTLPDGKARQLRGESVIINTGTRAAFEAIPGRTPTRNSKFLVTLLRALCRME